MKNYTIPQIILVLTPFVFSFALGLDIYIPIIPQMTEIFSTSPALVQLTLSLFLLVTGVGQLFVGPLSDQFGRKTILFWSAFFYGIGALGCALSTEIIELIIARVVTSFGACGMLVTSFAIVRDLYSGEKSAKMFSFLNGAIGISPTFAPMIGGHLAASFGWQSVFFFLMLIACLALFVIKYYVKETHLIEKREKMGWSLLTHYRTIYSNRQFLIYSSLAGLAEAVFFCFFSISPFIIIDLLGVPMHAFGYYFAVFGAVIGLGGFASGKVVEKIGIQGAIGCGICLMFLGGSGMIIWNHLGGVSLEGFLIPMIFACTGAMFVVGAAAAGALEPFPEVAGTAAAAFGAFEFAVSALIGILLMSFPVISTVPYGIAILLIACCSLFLFFLNYGSGLAKFKQTLS